MPDFRLLQEGWELEEGEVSRELHTPYTETENFPQPPPSRVQGLPCVARQELAESAKGSLSQGFPPFPASSQVPGPMQETSRAWATHPSPASLRRGVAMGGGNGADSTVILKGYQSSLRGFFS